MILTPEIHRINQLQKSNRISEINLVFELFEYLEL